MRHLRPRLLRGVSFKLRGAAWLFGIVVCIGCATSRPRGAPVQLVYQVNREAGSCPVTAQLKRSVSALLGYDPWVDAAPRQIHARIDAGDGALQAQIELQEGRASPIGTRWLEAGRGECQALVDAMALAISLAIDPLAVTKPKAQPPPVAARFPARPLLEGASLQLSAGGHLALGAAPAPAGGMRLEGALAWPRFSFGLGLRFDVPAERDVPPGGVSAHVLGGSLVVCGHHRFLFGCGLLAVQALHGEGMGLPAARDIWLPIVAPGARAGAQLFIRPGLALRLLGELTAPVVGARLVDKSEQVEFWRTPSVNGLFGLDLLAKVW